MLVTVPSGLVKLNMKSSLCFTYTTCEIVYFVEKEGGFGSDSMSKTRQGILKQDNRSLMTSNQNEDALGRSHEHLDLLKAIAEKASEFDTVQKKAFSKVRNIIAITDPSDNILCSLSWLVNFCSQ